MNQKTEKIIEFVKKEAASQNGAADGALSLRGEMMLVRCIGELQAQVAELTAERDGLFAQLKALAYDPTSEHGQ